MKTEEDVQMAWGITYLVKGFETAYNTDCTNFESDVNSLFQTDSSFNLFDFSWLNFNSEKPLLLVGQDAADQAAYTTFVFEGIYAVFKDFSIVVGALEIYIDSSSAISTF